MSKAWFDDWFNSLYYHTLYQKRGSEEARQFIDALVAYLKPQASDHVLDLGCGRGRHAVYLHQLGYQVTGLDIAPKNIAFAQKSANDRLHFAVHDMRDPIFPKQYNLILNLFTSFGYFEEDQTNQKVISHVADALPKGGRFLIDFMNVDYVKTHLVPEETRTIAGIEFDIRRKFTGTAITKEIRFEADGGSYHFKEFVKALQMSDFERYFEQAGLEICALMGNYQLEAFDAKQSERLIILTEKK
ncbi:class I SAM-dependent DNA methyltransferase [Penaeicola halotolerans]|uniref:class I SAM-dependent DNA methyltransferase n=1 Tax=Penaeicola halotolerans TaxID=2793196 RepID=UPI001CF8DB89|nr:class I SAM-dependent methyltransferase [Penaeicola halotolerans]